jgi:translation initiation factor IF-2
LNISLESCGLSKDKGYYEANPNTKISDDVYNVLCGQLLVTKGIRASKVGEEERRSFTFRTKKKSR